MVFQEDYGVQVIVSPCVRNTQRDERIAVYLYILMDWLCKYIVEELFGIFDVV